MIVSRKYFKGLISIPQINAAESGLLDSDLANWEQEILINRLGTETYVELLDHLDDASGIWHDLIKGKIYTNSSGYKRIFNGLFNSENLISPVADYCFYRFISENYGHLSIDGGTVIDQEKNSVEAVNTKQYQAAIRCISGFNAVYMYIRDMQQLESDNFPDYTTPNELNLQTNEFGI